MKKFEILQDKYITCDVIEKCLSKVQKKYPSVKIHKINQNNIFYLDSSLGKRIGSLLKTADGKVQFEMI